MKVCNKYKQNIHVLTMSEAWRKNNAAVHDTAFAPSESKVILDN